MLTRSTALLSLLAGLLLAGAGSFLTGAAPVQAACEGGASWASFEKVARSARHIVVGPVTRATDGIATRLRVGDVVLGGSSSIVKLTELRPRPRFGRDPECSGGAIIGAEVGDRLAIAFEGRAPGINGRIDSVALIVRNPNASRRTPLQRVTLDRVHELAKRRSGQGGAGLDRPGVEQRDSTDAGDGTGDGTGDGIGAASMRSLIDSVLSGLFAAPWPARPPAQLPPGAVMLGLWTEPPAEPTPPWRMQSDCRQEATSVLLTVEHGALVSTEGSVVWPRGFSARLVDGIGELVAPDGAVIGREGQTVQAGGGTSSEDGPFEICSVQGETYAPAS